LIMRFWKSFAAGAFAVAMLLGLGNFGGVSAAVLHSSVRHSIAVTIEEARKIALKKVPGTVEDEFSLEDDDGNTTAYIFVIKDAKKKVWEVQVGASKGDIVSVEEQESDDEDTDDPPASEDPPVLNAFHS
jgi:hypothetical protein